MTGLVSIMTSEYSSIPNFSSADGTVEACKKNTLQGREAGGMLHMLKRETKKNNTGQFLTHPDSFEAIRSALKPSG